MVVLSFYSFNCVDVLFKRKHPTLARGTKFQRLWIKALIRKSNTRDIVCSSTKLYTDSKNTNMAAHNLSWIITICYLQNYIHTVSHHSVTSCTHKHRIIRSLLRGFFLKYIASALFTNKLYSSLLKMLCLYLYVSIVYS